MTYQALLKKYQQLAEKTNHEASAIQLLLLEKSGLSPTELYLSMKKPVSHEFEKQFHEDCMKYIEENIPVQYIIGHVYFFGYPFVVNKDVLIPRPETEELVENALYLYDSTFGKNAEIDAVDIGTGSGCIAISMKCSAPNIKMSCTDISEEALATAKLNAQKNQIDMDFYAGDMLQPLLERNLKFDMILSNPPYIPQQEIVDPLVKDNEPNVALFGGEDGMKFYRIIISGARKLLKNENQYLIGFEHGFDKKQEMLELAKEYFPEAEIIQYKDMEGKDRMTFIRKRIL